MQKEWTIGLKLLLIASVFLIGTGAMYAFTYVFDLRENSIASGTVYTLVLVALGLGIPYIALKTLFSAAHTQNPRDEKEIHLADIADDQDQLAQKLDRRA